MNFVKNFMIFSKKEKIFKLYHGKTISLVRLKKDLRMY